MPLPSLNQAGTSSVTPAAATASEMAVKILKDGHGVPWLHARLSVRGPGGSGKSTTIEAMAGKEFDSSHVSTVGAGMTDIELHSKELELCESAR